MSKSVCAYCGGPGSRTEHVVPNNLYTPSDADQKMQRLTVRCCKPCNDGWSDDEAHFRNILTIAGAPNPAVNRPWPTVLRSFDKRDGQRRLRELMVSMRPVMTSDGERHMVFPGEDKRVMRIIRKTVRGLSHYHHADISPVLDQQVFANIMKFEVPAKFDETMKRDHRGPEVFQYKRVVIQQVGIHSAWFLTFFERTTFVGLVSMSPDGFKD